MHKTTAMMLILFSSGATCRVARPRTMASCSVKDEQKPCTSEFARGPGAGRRRDAEVYTLSDSSAAALSENKHFPRARRLSPARRRPDALRTRLASDLGGRKVSIRWSVTTSAPLTARIRAEYSEMPGLRLTVEQASRFLGLDTRTCEEVFRELERDGFLSRCPDGRYQHGRHV
jgi:hypothetical protein